MGENCVDLHFYISYRTAGKPQGKFFYFSSILAFVLALLSKSVTVILPLVLFLYDLCYNITKDAVFDSLRGLVDF